MKTLLNKLGLAVGLATSSMFTGCATTSDSPEIQQNAALILDTNALKGIPMKMLGIYAGQKAGEVAAAGDIRRAQSLELAGVGAMAIGDYQQQMAVAEAGRSQTNVIIQPAQYPQAQTVQTQPAFVKVMTANGWKDKNGDGTIEYPTEFINPGKGKYKVNEVIQGIFFGHNNMRNSLKAVIKNAVTNKIILETDLYIIESSSMKGWILPSAEPGIYAFTLMDRHNTVFGEALYEVKK